MEGVHIVDYTQTITVAVVSEDQHEMKKLNSNGKCHKYIFFSVSPDFFLLLSLGAFPIKCQSDLLYVIATESSKIVLILKYCPKTLFH